MWRAAGVGLVPFGLRMPAAQAEESGEKGKGSRDWLWLGVFAALPMLTKYSALVQFAVGVGFIVGFRRSLTLDFH